MELSSIWDAKKRIGKFIRRTPAALNRGLSEICGAQVYLKLEDLQKTGSFKVRGAFNRILTLDSAEMADGVVAFSSGNHGQAVAYAARETGVRATVVMPVWANTAKIAATKAYGARVVLKGDTSLEMQAEALRLAREESLAFLHPFEDWMTMAGQGTVGIEVLEDIPDLDAIFVPIGGGGLISGVAAAVKCIAPGMRVFGVQPSGSCSMLLSRRAGRVVEANNCVTAADGLMAKKPGEKTFACVERYVDDILMVSEEEIWRAQLYLLERGKLLAEPSGAVGLAGLLQARTRHAAKMAAIVSGGNCNLETLAVQLLNVYKK